MQQTRRFLLVVAVGVALFLGSTVGATSPPGFVSSNPTDAATISSDLSQYTLTFSTPVNPTMTGGYISDVNGAIVSISITVSADDPTTIIIGLAPNLSMGWYMVMWNTALSGSDDPLAGMTTFNIA